MTSNNQNTEYPLPSSFFFHEVSSNIFVLRVSKTQIIGNTTLQISFAFTHRENSMASFAQRSNYEIHRRVACTTIYPFTC